MLHERPIRHWTGNTRSLAAAPPNSNSLSADSLHHQLVDARESLGRIGENGRNTETEVLAASPFARSGRQMCEKC